MSSDTSKKQEKPTGLAGIFQNAAKTEVRSDADSRKEAMVAIKCKACGAQQETPKVFVCAYCGETLV